MDRARALASMVLPTPGTSSMSRCPSASSTISASLTASAFPSMTDSTAVPICCAVATRSSSARAVRTPPRPVSSTKKPSSKRPGARCAPEPSPGLRRVGANVPRPTSVAGTPTRAAPYSVGVYRQYVVPPQKCHARSVRWGRCRLPADGVGRTAARVRRLPGTARCGGNGAGGAQAAARLRSAFLPPLCSTVAELGFVGQERSNGCLDWCWWRNVEYSGARWSEMAIEARLAGGWR